MQLSSRTIAGFGLLLFVVATTVYLLTLTPTVPFWDSGEYIAVSYILGIPHPPGTPFYVLIGRIFTLIPWASVAERVNAMSAIAAAGAVALTFLTSLRMIRLIQGRERSRTDEWIAVAGAATGALLLAFSDSFWENSIEAEVYALMSLAQVLVLWLGLKWWEAHEQTPTAGPLLVCVYVMWLCVGLHLGVGIMGLPLMALIWLVDRRVALVFAMPCLTLLVVTEGLERLAGVILLLSTLTFLVYAAQKKINGWVAIVSAGVALFMMAVAFGEQPFTPGTAVLAVASVLVPLTLLAMRTRDGRILALALGLMVVGYSTHVYLPIRAAQNPAINEGNPSNWERLRDLLERRQYGNSGYTNVLTRRAPLIAQLDKEFWRYFRRQWPVFPTDRLWGSLLPLTLGLLGAWWQFRRERVGFATMLIFFGLTTAGMILFLNFTDHEVRERDYFFQSGYHAYTLWIGLGAAFLVTWIRESFAEGQARRLATVAGSALVLAQPVLLLKNLWYTHDRSGNYVAHDYAYNMLVPLPPNSFIFTNGDNDTFPLWYIQQVENFRKDVRVVNLSLLNTDWYIYQLRDQEPKVPITLDDKSIDALGQGLAVNEQGQYVLTSHFMLPHILRETKTDQGWKKEPYIAVTVPDRQGYEPYCTLEGLVYRVNPDTLGPEVDVEETRRSVYERFKYRGLFTADGSWDSLVYKDENAATLSRNYAAAHMQLAITYEKQGNIASAISEMERVERMYPGFVDVLVPLGRYYLQVGDTAKSLALFERLARNSPRSSDAHYYLGVTRMFTGQYSQALQSFEQSIGLDREHFYAYIGAYTVLWETGQREQAITYLERWLQLHPEDPQTRELLERNRREMGGGFAAPRPPGGGPIRPPGGP